MSIFSRLKKPVAGELKLAADAAVKTEGGLLPSTATSPSETEVRRAPAPAPKPNGVHPPAPKSAPADAPTPKTNGVADGKSAAPAAAPAAPAKQPALSPTTWPGVPPAPPPGPIERPVVVPPPAPVVAPPSAKLSADLAAIDMALGLLHAQAPKPAAPDAPTPKMNGVANSKAAAPAAAPAAPAKQPALSATTLPGVPPASPPARVERPVVVPPAAPVVVPAPEKNSVDLAIEMALNPGPAAAVAHGTSTASDQVAVRATFEDVAVPYVAEVRGVMMELQWGEVQASWLEMSRPVLRSLRRMAEPLGQTALVEALDRFDAALAEVLAAGQPPTPSAAAREALLAAYGPLRASLPRAFELEGERDRREPLIVRALLEQVPGLEPLMIEKMMAAGFGRLSALYAARADEIAAVTGIPDTVAAATAARIQAFRRATPAGLAVVDLGATVRELTRLLDELRAQHAAFEELSRGWSEKDRSAKGQLRRERQRSLLQITIEIVRLGEVDLAQRLDKLPFGKKIDEIEQLIGRAAQRAKAKHRADALAATVAATAT